MPPNFKLNVPNVTSRLDTIRGFRPNLRSLTVGLLVLCLIVSGSSTAAAMSPGYTNGPSAEMLEERALEFEPTSNESSALSKKLDAVGILRSIETPGSSLPPDAVDRLKRSRYHYRNAVLVDSPRVYSVDSTVLQQLSSIAASADSTERLERIDNASYLISTADRLSTRGKLVQTQRLIEKARNRGVEAETIARAEEKLVKARAAFESGRETFLAERLCCDAVTSVSTQREAVVQSLSRKKTAVEQFGLAYRRAQSAIELLHGAGVSRLTILSRADHPPDGSGPFPGENQTYNGSKTIAGTVFVTTPQEVDEVYVEINSNRTFAVPVVQPEEPLSNATFWFSVNLTQPINRIEVTANASVDNGTVAAPVAYDVLKLDGDGLPDVVEENITRTSPVNPDSDSLLTPQEEAGNGIPDYREDYDNDSVTTLRELHLDLDPVGADTDTDGLEDGYELYLSPTNATETDSNGNGIPDGADDPDGDGLSTALEAANGTHPRIADSDEDGLSDAEEIRTGTDPLDSDTDGDFLDDGTETSAPFNTNPTDPDTDDDGTVDGNETYTTTAQNISQGVEVTLTGQGDVAGGTSIKEPVHSRFNQYAPQPANVTQYVDIDPDVPVESAEITLQYDEANIDAGEESDLAIYRYNETTGAHERLDSTVDSVSNTVSADVSHFSTFVVLDTIAWQDIITGGGSGPDAMGFLEDKPINASVDAFTIHRNRTHNSTRILVYIPEGYHHAYGKIHISNGTFGRFLQPNDVGLDMNGNTDSQGNGNPVPGSTSTTTCSDDEVYVYDDSVDFNLATCDSMDSFLVTLNANRTKPTTISVTFRKIDSGLPGGPYLGGESPEPVSQGEEIRIQIPREDSDGDGIPDPIENASITLSGGIQVNTDWNDSDTDNDGLQDGEEVLINKPKRDGGFQYRSIPTTKFSDKDSLTDSEEINGWRVSVYNVSSNSSSFLGLPVNPYRYDYNNETSDHIHVTSDPLSIDTDGDGALDSVEKEVLHTDPRSVITYGRTTEHLLILNDIEARYHTEKSGAESRFSTSWDRSSLATQNAQVLGLISPDETADQLIPETYDGPTGLPLTDYTDDFDFVYASPDTFDETSSLIFDFTRYRSFPFSMNNYRAGGWTNRTDVWFPNSEEMRARTNVWDPDTDDDGLTDGQEERYVTKTRIFGNNIQRIEPGLIIEKDPDFTYDTDPTTPDTDGDGYWDGWLGVHSASNSRNVVLYMEHLQTGDGIESEEMVQAQAGIHNVTGSPTRGADIFGNGTEYHSNVHVGELHWGTDPADVASDPSAQTQLTVEVDYVRNTTWPGDGSPFAITKNGTALTTAIEENYALYGIDLTLVESDEISERQLRNVVANREPRSPPEYVTPGKLNRKELAAIEDEYHNDSSTLHMLWGPPLGNQNDSRTIIDRRIGKLYSSATGIAWHTGAPDSPKVRYIEESGFGIHVVTDAYQSEEYRRLQTTGMHELGHALSIGWADDAPIPGVGDFVGQKSFEVYSGSQNPDLAGGIDKTPERILIGGFPEREWSIMMAGTAEEVDKQNIEAAVFRLSIEELGTIDFEHIPSKSN